MLAQEPVEITFFIWAGSNQGVVPMEIIDAYKAANPNVKINILESNNAITYPQMVAAKRTTPDQPLVHCGFFNVDALTKGDAEGMWDTMDVAQIPNLANVLENFRRPEDRGVVGMECGGCHQDRNQQLTRVPGAPDWRLPPKAMAWEGRSPAELCAQLKDRARNGGRNLDQVVDHVGHDAFVAWGWSPGADRPAAPGTQAEFAALMRAWVESGAECPADLGENQE